ncbi:dienelactone hydrolase family protein [Alloacidobacterium dinghuense]|uniref:Dienelactone hydrolase family protein n=1 Tax=Alloacidobacterium dinghuense TaxID=2763107 RepID=A0A7G8BPX4_9BACT|nr:dienelactone hydrolase family protein [Alloacidobacterium dinghuense]QNI34594.1 dienelactone hydrolase family protein [Alloacidobacterium dinghuense]
MSEWLQLTASDGHFLDAYIAKPEKEPIAGLVVVQEIFGVNAHIRSVADSYARDGFLAIAPAIFDRIEKHVELGYEGADMQKAMSFIPKLNIESALLDVAAALDYAHKETGKKAGVIGYCFGGTVAWLSATRLKTDATVGYYGGGIGSFAEEAPKVPVMLHFGKLDTHIPKEEVDRVHTSNPEVQIFWYDAGHGFNCNPRSSYEPNSARIARERSFAFLTENLRG